MPVIKRWRQAVVPLRPFVAIGGMILLAGCASYQARPLPATDDLAAQVPDTINHQTLQLPSLRGYTLDPENGLDGTAIAMLAVVNNPQIKAQRKQRGVGQAQLFAAGLLPDPQFSFALDHPTSGGAGLYNAHTLGLNYDLMSLIVRGSKQDVARYGAQQTRLDIIWQEWQLAQQARQTYYRLLADQRKVAVLERSARTQKQRYSVAQDQLSQGNITLETLSSDLTGYVNIRTQLYQARLSLSDTQHKLNALLGLRPDVKLALKSAPDAVPDLPARLDTDPQALISRRPDLLALQAGYQSQEAKVRQSVLQQFPGLTLGLTQASDTSNVHTIGVGLQLNLPLWNANRGQIAIERATRDALWQTFQARIDQTVSDVDRLRSQFKLLQSQYQQLEASLPTLRQINSEALKAYRQGNFNSLSYLNIQDTLISKESQAIDLQLALWDARISLETMLGWPVDARALPSKPDQGTREKNQS